MCYHKYIIDFAIGLWKRTVFIEIIVFCRLGESEGSYCTLATFPLDTSSSSSSSESSTSSSPLPSPPTTPTQEKYRRAHLLRQQQRVPTDGTTKYRNFNFNSSHAVASLRSKPVSREVLFSLLSYALHLIAVVGRNQNSMETEKLMCSRWAEKVV